MLVEVVDHSNGGVGVVWCACREEYPANVEPYFLPRWYLSSSRSPKPWSVCNAQVPKPRPDLGPQLVEAVVGDDAEKVMSLLDQGAPRLVTRGWAVDS